MITSSADIQQLNFRLLLDISGPNPSITVSNASTASAPGNLKWIFEIYSPSGTIIHKGVFSAPDIVGAWTVNFVQASGFPKPMGIPELGTYKVVVTVRDAANHDFSLAKTVYLCRPAGNAKDQKNLYGLAVHSILTRCQQAQLFFEDKSSYSYQGLAGTAVTRQLVVRFPSDDTGVEPAAKTIDNFASALINISTNGEGYQSFQTSVFTYDMGDSVTIKVKYIGRSCFAVHCGLDLGVLGCEIKKLIDSIESGTCEDAEKAKQKLELINPKFALALMGIMNPQTCIDPYKLVEEIKVIGGFDCDCCASGINPLGTIADGTGPLSFNTNAHGDVTASFSISGNTVTLNIQDYYYVFNICDTYTGAAFTVKPSTTGTTRTYCLDIDQKLLAGEILTIINNNTDILNQFLTIINNNGGTVAVDPKCILPPTGSCDYRLVLEMSGQQLIESITVDGVVIPINFLFDQPANNTAELVLKLNGLSIGTWSGVLSGSGLTLTSTGNTHAVSEMHYLISHGNEATANLTKSNCSTAAPYTLQVIIQALIDYVCKLAATMIKMGIPFNIMQLATLAGNIQTRVTNADDSISKVVSVLLDSYNGLVKIVNNIKEVNCKNIQDTFSTVATEVRDDAKLYGGNNDCQSIPIDILAAKIIKLASTNTAVQTLFCQAINNCGKPACPPVTNAVVSYNSGIHKLSVVITNVAVMKYRVSYRVKNSTGPWMGTTEIDVTAGGTTTYQFVPTLSQFNWEVQIIALCAGSESTAYYAGLQPCITPGSFSVSQVGTQFKVVFGGIDSGTDHLQLSIGHPNGGVQLIDYPVSPTTVYIDIPVNEFGTFQFYLRAACDTAGYLLSVPAGPVAVSVVEVSGCRAMTALVVTALGENTATIVGTKPVGAPSPSAYILQLIPVNGGPMISLTKNEGGSTVTWNVSGLVQNTEYSYSVVSVCPDDQSPTYNGGVLKTLVDAGSTSLIRNDGSTTTRPVQVFIDDVLVFLDNDGIATTASDNFPLPNYTAVRVKVKAVGYAMANLSLLSNSITYNSFTLIGTDTAVIENVTIIGGVTIDFTDAP